MVKEDIVEIIVHHLPVLFWRWNLTFVGGQSSYENSNIE